MSYDSDQLVSWHEEIAEGRPPTGMTSLGVDADAGVLELVLRLACSTIGVKNEPRIPAAGTASATSRFIVACSAA